MLLIVFRHFCRENTNAHPRYKQLWGLKNTLETEVLCGKVNLSNSWPIWDAKKKCGKNTSELELHLHLTNSLEPSQQWITFQISLFYGKNFSTEWPIVTMNVCVCFCARALKNTFRKCQILLWTCVCMSAMGRTAQPRMNYMYRLWISRNQLRNYLKSFATTAKGFFLPHSFVSFIIIVHLIWCVVARVRYIIRRELKSIVECVKRCLGHFGRLLRFKFESKYPFG